MKEGFALLEGKKVTVRKAERDPMIAIGMWATVAREYLNEAS